MRLCVIIIIIYIIKKIIEDYFEINALYFVKESNLDRFGQAIQEVLSFYDVQQNSIGVKSEQQYLMYKFFVILY